MKRRYASLIACALILSVGCGDDDGGNNDPANNGSAQNNGTDNNGTDNNGTDNNGTDNNGVDSTAWHAEFTDSEVELPEANGQFLMVVQSEDLSKITSSNNITGAFLNASFPSLLMTGDMTPTSLRISFINDGIICDADPELVVTFDSVDPTKGSFAGPMSCTADDGATPFTATVTSTFEAN